MHWGSAEERNFAKADDCLALSFIHLFLVLWKLRIYSTFPYYVSLFVFSVRTVLESVGHGICSNLERTHISSNYQTCYFAACSSISQRITYVLKQQLFYYVYYVIMFLLCLLPICMTVNVPLGTLQERTMMISSVNRFLTKVLVSPQYCTYRCFQNNVCFHDQNYLLKNCI